jgi:hypothetical protein
MIVIATNNGKKNLIELLSNLKSINFNCPVSIIDTGSTDQESIDFLNTIESDINYKFDIKLYKTPYRGYDTGAYIYAINNIDAERYYFIQDSIRIKSINFFQLIDSKLEIGKVIPLITFGSNLYDYQEQIDFCLSNFGKSDFKRGIFGPIFSILKEDIDKIDKKYLVYPTNKSLQMGMERGWSVIFESHNFDIDPLEGDYNYSKLINDQYNHFKKIIQYRS